MKTLQEISTREDFYHFLGEIIWELQYDPSQWYYVHLLEYLSELQIHMSDHPLENKSDTSITFKELATNFDNARRDREDD
jgi:hypothetical protein